MIFCRCTTESIHHRSDAQRYNEALHSAGRALYWPLHYSLFSFLQRFLTSTMTFITACSILALGGNAAAFSPAATAGSSSALRSAVASETYTFTKSNEIFEEAKTVSCFSLQIGFEDVMTTRLGILCLLAVASDSVLRLFVLCLLVETFQIPFC